MAYKQRDKLNANAGLQGPQRPKAKMGALWVMLLAAPLTGGAGNTPGPSPTPSPGTGDIGRPKVFAEPCANGDADAETTIPVHDVFPTGAQKNLLSGDDKYWYERYQGSNKGCDRFVVDFLVNNESNKKIDPATGYITYGDIALFGISHNLPSAISPPINGHSSGPQGATTPTTQVDCETLQVDVRVYEKLHTDKSFRVVQNFHHTGKWTGNDQEGECTITPHFGAGYATNAIGKTAEYDTYRVAAKVTLRELPQEVRIVAESREPPLP